MKKYAPLLFTILTVILFLLAVGQFRKKRSSPLGENPTPQINTEQDPPKSNLKQRLKTEMDRAAEKVDWSPPALRHEGWVSPDSDINTSTDPRMP